MFLKICGLTRREDALQAVEQGATALGFILWPRSPRYVTPAQVRSILEALPAAVKTVGVFVNEPVEGILRTVAQTGLSAVQLQGDEPPSYGRALAVPLLRSVTLAGLERARTEWPGATLLVDAADPVRRGGTGVTVDWTAAARLARRGPFVLAGGLTPANVGEAIRIVRPCGVDVASGVESVAGVKDVEKVRAFLDEARRAFDQMRAREMYR